MLNYITTSPFTGHYQDEQGTQVADVFKIYGTERHVITGFALRPDGTKQTFRHITSGIGADTDSPENVQRMRDEITHDVIIPHGCSLNHAVPRKEFVAGLKAKSIRPITAELMEAWNAKSVNQDPELPLLTPDGWSWKDGSTAPFKGEYHSIPGFQNDRPPRETNLAGIRRDWSGNGQEVPLNLPTKK